MSLYRIQGLINGTHQLPPHLKYLKESLIEGAIIGALVGALAGVVALLAS